MDYFKLHKKLENLFKESGITEPADIDWLMVHVLGVSRGMLPFVGEIDEASEKRIVELAKIRATHVPLGFVLGESDFFGRNFMVSSSVLIPRMDTEILVEAAIKHIKQFQEAKHKKPVVLDMGTGSGAIAITLALETSAKVVAVDVSEEALEVAKENAKRLKANVRFACSDLFDALNGEKFDFVVSNPPYIKTAVIETLEEEVKNHEPHLALDGGESGLDFYKKIVCDAKSHLNKNGMLFFEIGFDQAESVKNLMQKYYKNIEILKDYGGNDRVVFGRVR